jgi:hypothetical protein
MDLATGADAPGRHSAQAVIDMAIFSQAKNQPHISTSCDDRIKNVTGIITIQPPLGRGEIPLGEEPNYRL